MGEERIIPVPPLPRHREGEILRELPNPAGLVLWQDVRHVRDWAGSAPETRRGLFSHPTTAVIRKRKEAHAFASELAGPLDEFAVMKTDPLKVDVAGLARACEHVVNWALERDHTETAIEWAEVAALVDETSPRLANLAGRVTRNANLYDRAELWFKRGLGFARDQDDTIELVRGHLGYGTLCKEMGRVNGARRHLNAGANMAWREGPPSLAAEAQHDLCAMLIVRGHLAEAAGRARKALTWYPKSHHRIPFFAADVALMLVLGRRFVSAGRLVRVVLRMVQQPTARATILALGARAYAGAGEPEESAVLRRRAVKLLEHHRGMEPVTRWHLADAQRLAGNWETAEEEAETALNVAIAQNDREIERLTRILLKLIRNRKSAPPKMRGSRELHSFLNELAERVAGWSPRRGDRPGPWGSNWAA
jgi:tetratricopeptide (TPR) repeat protein